jgi:hypothetical protein
VAVHPELTGSPIDAFPSTGIRPRPAQWGSRRGSESAGVGSNPIAMTENGSTGPYGQQDAAGTQFRLAPPRACASSALRFAGCHALPPTSHWSGAAVFGPGRISAIGSLRQRVREELSANADALSAARGLLVATHRARAACWLPNSTNMRRACPVQHSSEWHSTLDTQNGAHEPRRPNASAPDAAVSAH